MPTFNRSVLEQGQLDLVRGNLTRLKAYLDANPPPGMEAGASTWFSLLEGIKRIVGNADNAMSFVACLMAKDYLTSHLPMADYDAAAKPQGAPGLDIDERTLSGERVVGEIKTTIPYKGADLGAQQKDGFVKDFKKLNAADAPHKFFFVTDKATFEVVKRKYGSMIPGVTVVLLTTGERFLAAKEVN